MRLFLLVALFCSPIFAQGGAPATSLYTPKDYKVQISKVEDCEKLADSVQADTCRARIADGKIAIFNRSDLVYTPTPEEAARAHANTAQDSLARDGEAGLRLAMLEQARVLNSELSGIKGALFGQLAITVASLVVSIILIATQ